MSAGALTASIYASEGNQGFPLRPPFLRLAVARSAPQGYGALVRTATADVIPAYAGIHFDVELLSTYVSENPFDRTNAPQSVRSGTPYWRALSSDQP